MKELILTILKEEGMMKVTELAMEVWCRQNHFTAPDIWYPTPVEHEGILKTKRLLMLFLPQMLEDKLVNMTLDYKWITLGRMAK